ncbi:MAG: hypothetical protein PVG40_09245 [Desulfobacterales bacterium]|jgi:hypothetical protein
MKKRIIVAVGLVTLIALGFVTYFNLKAKPDPCASVFDQTTVSLTEKINILKKKGDTLIDGDQFQKLLVQAEQLTADLKTCCILFQDDKIVFDDFLKCQDDFRQYEQSIDRLSHQVAETQVARQQQRYDLVNSRLAHIERNIKDLAAISEQFQSRMSSFLNRQSDAAPLKPIRGTDQTASTETEPNDSFNQGIEISSGVLTGTLSGDDRQDYFRFELDAGDILNLDFTAGEDSELLKIALRDFKRNELWNSGETGPGVTRSTRMLMNNLSGGIYYAVVYSGIGPYKLDLFIESQNDAGSGVDAGDRITKALAITPNRSFLGEMGGFDEEDWYRFDIRPGHILKLAFGPSESSEAMKFSLRSFEHSEVWYSGVVLPGETKLKRVMMNTTSGGTYYLEAYYGDGRYGFDVFIEKQNDALSGTDAGDKMADAHKILPGRSYSGELGGYDETDWYRFDMPAGSILNMSLTSNKGSGPIQFSFRNVDGTEIWRSDEVPPDMTVSTRLMTNNTTGGIYFLEVLDGSGTYEFEILTEQQNDAGLSADAGDRITEAVKITAGRPIAGELGGLDEQDWYTFSDREGKTILFSTAADGEPLKLSIGDVAHRKGLYTAELTPGTTRTFEVPQNVRPPYYLRVYGGSSTYSFEIQ